MELNLDTHIGEKLFNNFPEIRQNLIKNDEFPYYTLIRNNHCPLLQKNNLCAAEAKLGREYKPYACRLFPFIFYETEKYLLARVYPCDNWQWYMGPEYDIGAENYVKLYQELKENDKIKLLLPTEKYLENTLTDNRIEKELNTIFYKNNGKRLLEYAFNGTKIKLPDDYDKTIDFIKYVLTRKFQININLDRLELEQFSNEEQEIVEGYLNGALKFVTFIPHMIATDFENSVMLRNFILLLGAYKMFATIKLQKNFQFPNPYLNDIAWGMKFEFGSKLLKYVLAELRKTTTVKNIAQIVDNFEKSQLTDIIKTIFQKD